MVYGYQDYQNEQNMISSGGFGGKKYYWMGVIRNGKLVILGWRNSEIEAAEFLESTCPGDQHVIESFNSKDIHRVSGAFKSKALQKYRSLDIALKRNIISQSEQMKAKKYKPTATGQKDYKKQVKESKGVIPDMFEGMSEM